MGPKVLALIESNIGMRYTLDTRLTALGFQVTILTAPAAFEKRLASEAFDWIILDAATMQPHRRRFLERLDDRRKGARVVWCGKPPRNAPVRFEAIFNKPLRYDAVGRFFARWAAVGRPEPSQPGPHADARTAPAGARAEQTEAPHDPAVVPDEVVKTDEDKMGGGTL
jgi:hypothetical protein